MPEDTSRKGRWETYRERNWPAHLRELDKNSPGGMQRWAEFDEYRAMAADRQAKATLTATWVLVAATVGLVLATIVLAYITAKHTGH